MSTHAQLIFENEIEASCIQPVFPKSTFSTSWQAFDCLRLKAGERVPRLANCEQGLLILHGKAAFVDNELAALQAPSAVLLSGTTHHLRALTPCIVLSIQVAMTEPDSMDRPLTDVISKDKLIRRPSIHGGGGEIATRHIWTPASFSSNWTFFDHAILSQSSAVGYHYHDALEECFVVTSGCGYMTVDGETFEVGPGSVTFQGIRQGHGIYNPNSKPLDFLRIAVAMPGEQVTTIDLNDDLTKRSP